VVLCVGLAGLFSADPSMSADTKDPDAYMAAPRWVAQDTLNQVMAVLAKKDASSRVRVSEIEQIVFNVFDFSTMSKLVLARNWKRFNDEQRKEFTREFKLYLSRTYGGRLDRFSQTNIEVYGARIEPRGDVTVLSRVVGGEFDGITMNYRMRERKGQWKVIDVIVENVSLVSNFRSQFGEVISRGGPESLFAKMQAKNAEQRLIDSEAE
jgi:phospholipid transport system substrate-binding protein